MTYDLETLMYEMKDFVKERLNTEIQNINAEKSDGIEAAEIVENAYAVQSLDNKIMNFENFVLIQTMSVEAQGSGPATLKSYSIMVMIVAGGLENNLHSMRHMFRYGRALESIFNKYWDRSNSHKIKLKVQAFPPLDYTDLNQTKRYRAVGLVLTGDLA